MVPLARREWHRLFEDNDHLLFGSRKTAVDISTLHPDPVKIFRLWQVYLDNVNPLLKVTHTPSLQGRIIEAVSDVSNIAPYLEALLFSIYCMAVLSLAAEDCQLMFGASKVDLLTRYQFGCQQALLNCKFLQCDDRDCLTALYLYLVSPLSHASQIPNQPNNPPSSPSAPTQSRNLSPPCSASRSASPSAWACTSSPISVNPAPWKPKCGGVYGGRS